MSGGRPTKYDPLYCEALIEHMAKGLSYEAFAGSIKVAKQTLYDWEKAHPEFLDAKSIAIEQSRLFWEQAGVAGLINPYQGDTLNTSLWIFNMKNRFGWRDRQPDEVERTEIKNEIALTSDQIKEFIKTARGEK